MTLVFCRSKTKRKKRMKTIFYKQKKGKTTNVVGVAVGLEVGDAVGEVEGCFVYNDEKQK